MIFKKLNSLFYSLADCSTKKTKIPSLVVENLLIGQQRRFLEASKVSSSKSD